jgi:AraC family transcriptional regulator
MTDAQTERLLVDSPLARVYDIVCRDRRSAFGPAMRIPATQVALPRRGVFVLERRGSAMVVDPTTALLLEADDEYRIRHPTDAGDAGVVVVLPPESAEELKDGHGERIGRLDARDHLVISLVIQALREPGRDSLEAEDASVSLLALVSRAFGRGADRTRMGPAQRRRVERTRAALAASPTARWDLRTVGAVVGSSPYHLARQFRAATGETISGYVLRLRLGVALERLAEGERDIAAVAVDAGFSHHSHFTARFHAAFGMTPRDARELLTRRRLDEERPRGLARARTRRQQRAGRGVPYRPA